MPIEKRDLHSGAKLFIPTTSEKTLRSKAEQYNEGLKEIENMKSELEQLLKEHKTDKK